MSALVSLFVSGADRFEAPETSAQKEVKIPPIQDLLGPDQTIITPHYMKQLLCYAQSLDITDENDPQLDVVAQVSPTSYPCCLWLLRFGFSQKLVEELRSIQL